MKIDVTQVLKNLQGEDMKIVYNEVKDERQVVKEKPMVFRDLVTDLLNQESNEHRLTSEQKSKAFQIMKKLWDSEEADLTIDQRALINERARFFYPTMTQGVLAELLEDKNEDVKDKEKQI